MSSFTENERKELFEFLNSRDDYPLRCIIRNSGNSYDAIIQSHFTTKKSDDTLFAGHILYSSCLADQGIYFIDGDITYHTSWHILDTSDILSLHVVLDDGWSLEFNTKTTLKDSRMKLIK